MVDKKTPKADLENKKVYFIQIGLILALVLVFLGFEWKTYDKKVVETFQRQVTNVAEEIVLITQQKVEVAAAPPPATTTIINIVEDDVAIDDEIVIDAEATATSEVQQYVPVKHEEEEIVEAEIFQIVESMPDFPGGDEARMTYLRDNIKYPQIARESSISGTVYVTFVVEKDGRVTDIKILRGIGGGCDEEAMRVIKAMPRWKPGKQRGKPVRVQFNMPIKFTLQG
ncbi:MAG TPA: energy transducer TonB [Bacteroidales bacterium]|nr:MAG: hypothetical protein A2X11_03665 [Bacteroidetes bacterium GWE2_42_24]OFY32680.1 MAG: hypothetical protein A2X09_06455 [Bacteroidetes bacterium GWF2_43_11]PKP20385.1 MAG: energy transducer TonB [Bacteroidetes bacterium HGW-Bacteroidetes-22]HAQ66116.1 energy transducer TonB [Bacteroidales bacterium]HBZ65202.1 energy transducer TonB [Bacteroidales bacterium]